MQLKFYAGVARCHGDELAINRSWVRLPAACRIAEKRPRESRSHACMFLTPLQFKIALCYRNLIIFFLILKRTYSDRVPPDLLGQQLNSYLGAYIL